MNPFFLRRFGAALVCSLIVPVAAASLALAEPEAAAKPADSAKTEPAAKAEDAPAAKADDAPAAKKADDAKAAPKADGAQPEAKAEDTKAAKKPDAALPPVKTLVQSREEAEREGRRNGARLKSPEGSLLVWDNVSSVWIATERKNTYWVDDRYYAFDDGVWVTSKVIAGPWDLVSSQVVPEAPRGRHSPPKKSVTADLPAGLEAVYDPRIKVFKIAGRKGVFLHDARFYQWEHGVWLVADTIDGPWSTSPSIAVPAALRRALSTPEKGTKATLPGGDVLVSEGEPNLFGVEGKPDVLYFDGTFYERRDAKWFSTESLSLPWEEVTSQKIPGTVRQNYHKKGDKDSDKKKGGDKKKSAAKKKQGDKKKPGAQAAAKKKAAGKAGDEKAQAKAKKKTDDTDPESDAVEE